jgi:hypothetical protein
MRTTPQHKRDRQAWPVTLRILVPDGGLQSLGRHNNTDQWLLVELGRGEYALTRHRSIIGDVVEFHFRSLHAALRFRERFPTLSLADETAGPLWFSPEMPNGRR